MSNAISEMDADFLADAFEFLDDLRESGATNMFGARPYLQEEFALTGGEAGVILTAWMSTFDGDTSVYERVALSQGAADNQS